MHAGELIGGIGLGVLLELAGYLLLTRPFRLAGKAERARQQQIARQLQQDA